MRDVGRVGAGGATRPGRPGGRGQGGFTIGPSAHEAPGEAAAAGAAVPIGLGLLSLQEGDNPERRDHAARRRAESILEELQALQHGLLHDAPDMNRLGRLAALQEGEAGADPRLQEVVRQIVLRARVELARRGWNDPVSKP